MSSLEILERSFRRFSISDLRITVTNEFLVGIYMLTVSDKVVYVGSSRNIVNRLRSHRTGKRDRHFNGTGPKRFNRAIWYPLPVAVHPFYEGAFIRFLDPSLNYGKPPAGGEYDDEIISGFGLDPSLRPNPDDLVWRKYARELGERS